MTPDPSVAVQCGRCDGLVAVPASRMSVTRPHGSDSPAAAHFVCTGCGHPNVKPLSPEQLASLVGAGVRGAEESSFPTTPRPARPTLTLDDLLDFALALEATDDLVAEARR